jgi:hypothetical protein
MHLEETHRDFAGPNREDDRLRPALIAIHRGARC